MNPVPLTDPTGTVRAWMCGCCGHAGEFPSRFGKNADAYAIERSRLNAEECCVCRQCDGPAPRVDCALVCKSCQEKNAAKADDARQEKLKTHRECSKCCGYGWVDHPHDDCPACDGDGWVKRTEDAP